MPLALYGVFLVRAHGEGAEHSHRLVLQEARGEEGKGRMIETLTELIVNLVWPHTEVLVLTTVNIQPRILKFTSLNLKAIQVRSQQVRTFFVVLNLRN